MTTITDHILRAKEILNRKGEPTTLAEISKLSNTLAESNNSQAHKLIPQLGKRYIELEKALKR